MFVLVSCLGEGGYSESYQADITFDYSSQIYLSDFKDSVFVSSNGDAFTYMRYPLAFFYKNDNGAFAGGFTMSYLKGEKDGKFKPQEQENDLFRVNSDSGASGSMTYAVFYDNPDPQQMPGHAVEFGLKEYGYCTMSGCYVNNSTLVARRIKEHFKVGDKLVLKAIGHKSTGGTAETKITLAEYTEAKDSIMYNWTPFILSSLGPVNYVDFVVESTNENVPEAFCMDGLLVQINVSY